MKQRILSFMVCFFMVLGLSAQQRNENRSNVFMKTRAANLSIEKVYEYTGGDSHQSTYEQRATLFEDDLEGGNLDNFTIINGGDANGFVYSDTAGNMAPGCVILSFDSDTAHNDWLILPQLTNVQAFTKVSFWAKNRTSGSFSESFDVLISTTGNAEADFTTTLSENIVPPRLEYEYYEFSLTEYVGQDVYFAIHSTTLDKWKIYFDDFKVFTPKEHDLSVTGVNKLSLISLGNSDTPSVMVKNRGANEENNFNVQLQITKVGETVASYDETVNVTDAVAVDATAEVTFPAWTPAAGEYSFKAIVTLAGDGDASNDTLVVEENSVCADLTDMAYACVVYSPSVVNGVVAFNPETPSNEVLRVSTEDIGLEAGAVIDGVWYGVTDDKKLVNVNFTTGGITVVADLSISEGIIMDMAYDYSTGQMFGTHKKGQQSKFITIDLTDGTVSDVGTIVDLAFYGLACNLNGILYGIAGDGNLYTIDKTTGAQTSVGATGVTDIKYLQSATFNHTNGKLYWAQQGQNSYNMYEVNTATGAATDLGALYGETELTSMVYNFTLPTYPITFNVTDGTNPIEGAVITVGNKTATTDAAGQAALNLSDNTYNYTVLKAGFANVTGTFTVEGAAQTVDITMTAGDAEWTVEFTVNNDLGALAGATVTMDGQTATTDDLGKAALNHINATNLEFTVTAALHDTYTGTVTINDAHAMVDVMMTRTVHNFNFVVKKSWGSNDAIEGASVNIVSGDSSYVATTDASGVANFTDKLEGAYTYTVSAEGYASATADVELTADVDQEVLLDEKVEDPYALMIDINSDTTAIFSWNNATGFFDDFESYDDFSLEFSPWILRDEDGSPTYGFQNLPFEHSGEPMAAIIFNPSAVSQDLAPAHSGNKFSATFNPAATPAVACNDWLIAPKTKVVNGDKVTFFARGGHANYSAEKFQVMISETDTEITSFTNITDVVTCNAGSVEWVEYSYDIPAEYAGKEVYIALHVTSLDQFYFCLDDFKIGNPEGAKSRTLQSYTVTLDGEEKATGLTETSFEFTDLSLGTTYVAGVKAIYETGESTLQTLEFTMPAVNVIDFASEVSISPNPTNGIITINANGMFNIEIVDLTGKVLYAEQINNATDIDLSGFNTGMYIIRLTNDSNHTIVKKIIKN